MTHTRSNSNSTNYLEPLEPRLLLSGTIYVVDSLLDVVEDDGVVTLREAIEAANTNSAVTPDVAAGSDTESDIITFAPALFDSGPATITLGGTQLSISDDLEIQGPGADLLTIDANGFSNVITLYSTQAKLDNLTLTGAAESGINIVGNSTLILESSTVTQNAKNGILGEYSTIYLNDSVISSNASSGFAPSAIRAFNCILTIVDTSVTGNAGSGVYCFNSSVALVNSTLGGNTSDYGGAIRSYYSDFSVINSILVGNTATENGGAVYKWGDGTFAISNSTLVSNVSSFGSNVVFADNFTVNNSIIAIENDWDLQGFWTGGNNLIGSWAAFVRNPSPGDDGIWGTADDDYGDLHLTGISPAIDSGDDALLPADTLDLDNDGNMTEPVPFDRDGNTRVFGDRVDIGAYEYQSAPDPGREAPSATVTTLDDVVDPYDGHISLREAVFYTDLEGMGSLIDFDPSLTGGTLTLAGQSLWIDKSLTIDAAAAPGLTIDAGGQSGLLYLNRGQRELTLIGLTLTGGSADQPAGVYAPNSIVTLTDTTITGNNGGGIVGSTISLTDSAVTGNTGIGIIADTIDLIGSEVSYNIADGIVGDTVSLTDSAVTGNTGIGITGTDITLVNSQ